MFSLHFLAILSPKPDRVARVSTSQLRPVHKRKIQRLIFEFQVEEIAESVSNYVKENEPGVLQYQWFRTGTEEKPKIVVWEQ